MKIAMLGHKAVPSTKGGIETVLTTLCPMMAERGAEIVCYNRSMDEVGSEYAGEIKNGVFRGVRLKKAFAVKKRGISAMTASFTAAIKASFSDCDIVHFHAEGPCGAMFIPKMFGKKCVATVHGLDWQREKWGKGFASRYIKHGERSLVKYADAVIVLGEAAKTYFLQTYGRETTVIPNGISKPRILEANIIKSRFGLYRNSYIAIVSRLTEEKGVHLLIEAFGMLRTDKKLVICGEASDTDEYVKHLRKMADGNKNIIFTGFVSGDTLGEIYSNAYAVCLPSSIEGMSLSLLEALSYGNAVVCSDIPENVSVTGDTALSFKKGDARDLASKLQYLIDNVHEAEQYKSISDSVCGRFPWEKTADMTLSLYKGLIKNRKGDF